MAPHYDTIGLNYAELRKPDRRIVRVIEEALGSARSVLNVGAGTGSYESIGREVTAVEPSIEMIRKRSPSAAPAIQAVAESLPFEDNRFDAAMAILTVHHWTDIAAGLREMRRVTQGRIVLLTFDPSFRPWLTDYLPHWQRLTICGYRPFHATKDGSAKLRSRLFQSLMIARTVFSTLTGAAQKPISTRASEPGAHRFGR
jgi:ubiquinone/menaquinone biosynthesis C-methylase UbiE